MTTTVNGLLQTNKLTRSFGYFRLICEVNRKSSKSKVKWTSIIFNFRLSWRDMCTRKSTSGEVHPVVDAIMLNIQCHMSHTPSNKVSTFHQSTIKPKSKCFLSQSFVVSLSHPSFTSWYWYYYNFDNKILRLESRKGSYILRNFNGRMKLVKIKRRRGGGRIFYTDS